MPINRMPVVVDYKWYRIIDGTELQQGDFILDLEVPIVGETEQDEPPVPVEDEPPVPLEMETFDTIVLTQSCDIQKEAVEHVVLCPVWDIKEAAKIHPMFGTPEGREGVRKGRVPAFHLLNQCDLPDYQRDYMVVQFERIIVSPKDTILALVASQQNHLRLLPPYREEMAQRFGMFFARVGLPTEIPSFKS